MYFHGIFKNYYHFKKFCEITQNVLFLPLYSYLETTTTTTTTTTKKSTTTIVTTTKTTTIATTIATNPETIFETTMKSKQDQNSGFSV